MPQTCSDCGGSLEVDGTELICNDCGLRVRNYSSTTVGGSGRDPESSAPVVLRLADGPGPSHGAPVVICQVAPYKKTTKAQVTDEIRRLLDARLSTPSAGQFPARVISDTADLFYEIQVHQTLRGDVRKGTIAACFFWACRHLGMVQKNEFLAKLFGVHRNALSNGNKIIEHQVNCGLIPPPPPVDMRELMRNYLQQYFDAFGLPRTSNGVCYFDFCLRVAYFCWRKNIGYASVPSSKCAGSLQLLASRNPNLLDVSRIKEVCECTPSTAKRFSSAVESFLVRDPEDVAPERRPGLLLTIRKLRHIFRVCGLPLAPVRERASSSRSRK